MLLGADIPLLAVRKQIASAIDIIVHLGRLRDRTRRVMEITEILTCRDNEIQLNPLLSFVEKGEENGKIIGNLEKINELIFRDKLLRAGLGV